MFLRIYRATKKHDPIDIMYRVQLWKRKQTNQIPLGPLDFLACVPLLTFLLFKHKHYTVPPRQDLQAVFISSFFSFSWPHFAMHQKKKRAHCKFYCSQVKKTPEKERVTMERVSDPNLALVLSFSLALCQSGSS